jgi:hypothetical protein
MPMKRFLVISVAVLAAAVLTAGCGAKRPVLYPNAHLERVGSETARADIDACMQMAEAHVSASGKGGRVLKDGAKGAAIGAAAGAAVSAVLGGNVGRSAAAGAAGGGAAGATRSALNSDDPDPVFRGFVDRCLREKGYDVVGWK